MAEYKVTRISASPPKEHYSETYKNTTYYIKVMLEGHDRPVTVGKKSPDALKVGDIVSGQILQTQYETDKFKAESKPYPSQAAPRDNSEIRAQFAIKAAIAFGVERDNIESQAIAFFQMVDRVKNPHTQAPMMSKLATGYEKAKAAAAALKVKQTFSDGSPVDEVYPVGDEPINLDDIPF